ncbi:organic cation transporter protein [Contarinia nasturtii]|uniref:organic cation transporter protein n=1 Tax=Contarinia nasturtii TaxID=265458 RepID=UPI0012D3B5F3|nr:organic cation transporter protein [Contarinia nasturtii]
MYKSGSNCWRDAGQLISKLCRFYGYKHFEPINVTEKKRNKNMDFDLILEEIGQFGRYQQTNYLLLCLPVLFGAANSLTYIFTAGIPQYRCFVPSCDDPINPNYDEPWVSAVVPGSIDSSGLFAPEQCLRYELPLLENNSTYLCGRELTVKHEISCTRWVFDKYEKTIVEEWSITCKENQYLLAFVGTAHFAGIVVGSAAAGILADNYGRKIIFILSTVFMAITGIGQALSQNYSSFVFFAFLNAVGTAGVFPMAFIMGVEMVGAKKREMSGIILNYFYSVGEAIVGLIFWLCRDWVLLQLIVSVPPLLFIAYYWFIPESVRWLLARKDYTKAKKIIQKAADVNGVELSEQMLHQFELNSPAHHHGNVHDGNKKKQPELGEVSKEQQEYHEVWRTFKEVLCSRVLVLRGLILFFIWASDAFIFYGLSLNSTNLSGNKYLNFILVCLVEIPGYTLSWIAMNKIGRRWALSASLLLCAFTCVAGGSEPLENTWAVVTLFLLGKLGITSAFSTSYVHTSEILPTVIRSMGVGSASTVARLGALVAPFVPLLSNYYRPLPLLLFGAVSLLAGLLALLLPETFGRKLPDTAEEAEQIGTDDIDISDVHLDTIK